MAAYSRVLKPHGWPGNVAVAAVAGLPLAYGALAVGRPAAGAVPWLVAGWLHLVREVVKDVDDARGDRAIGRRTLPVRIGRDGTLRVATGLALLFLPVSAGARTAGCGWPYFAIAAPAWRRGDRRRPALARGAHRGGRRAAQGSDGGRTHGTGGGEARVIWWQAAVLGLVQGLSEFLPVSSDGHLVLAGRLTGAVAPGVAFEVMLHLATLAAVMVVYGRQLGALTVGVLRWRREDVRYVALLAVATVPR
jgi:hypothetical protein